MLIGKQMFCGKSESLVLLVILLFASVAVSLDNSQRAEEVLLSQLLDPATGKINEGTEELLWINCMLDLICLKEANEDLSRCFPEETSGGTKGISSQGLLLSKQNIQKLITLLHPKSKQTLLDCIQKNSLPLHFFGEGGSKIRSAKFLNYLHSRPSFLRRKLLQSISEPPGSAVGSPFPSPAPSPDLAPSPKNPFFPPVGEPPPPPGENSSVGPFLGPSIEPDPGKSNHKSIVIAIVVTATVTFVVAALFFFCCTRICRRGSGVRRNDERPLLSLSLTDYSVGSTHKSFGVISSIKEGKLGHQHLNSSSVHDKKDSSLDGKLDIKSDGLQVSQNETPSLNTSNKITGLVPLPPGRISSSSSLKPPPGRADPLPPEPRASLRPPSSGPPPSSSPAPSQPPNAFGRAAPPPGPPLPPPVAPNAKAGPRPPPPAPPKKSIAPPQPPPPLAMGSRVPRPPAGSKLPSNSASAESAGVEGDADAPKAKLKPFFWDKVLANPDHSMVWHQIKSGSFQFNEEMIESLFGYASADKGKNERKKESSSRDPSPQYIQILDPKKAQNLSILLRALNVTTEEVCEALHEGNELPAELLQTLLKMAPTADEELKLRLFTGELSQLGPAERFLKALVDIPFAFKRMEILLFICTLQEDVSTTKESFETLEVACKELRSSRLFLKLLEAVLKTGNRMNDGTFRGGAQAFKLDTLLKLSDVKGTDGKITLLHFVVQEIIRSEGVRAARTAKESQSFSGVSLKTDDLLEDIKPDTEEHFRSLGLQVVSCLSSELDNVKKAAIVDADSLTGTVTKLGQSLLKTRDFLNKDMKNLEEDSGFHEMLKSFVQNAEVDVMWLLEEEKRIMTLVKNTGDYFHGKAGKDEGLRLFVIVRDFLIMLDKVCKEVREAQKRSIKTLKKESSTTSSSSDPRQQPSPNFHQRLFPAIAERRMDDFSSSSDDEK
uniref:Formin-like protein n=1 Tax=Rhizophora mucronata TaxID=61149 RepID=A0A2P2JAD4_RHIMU